MTFEQSYDKAMMKETGLGIANQTLIKPGHFLEASEQIKG